MSELQIAKAWSTLYEEVSRLEKKFSKKIQIIPVSKAQSIQCIEDALKVPKFPRILAESYLDEALEKMSHLKEKKLEWHFIGRLQSRKIVEVAQHFSVIHTVGRLKEIENLARSAEEMPRFFLQINISREVQKNGFPPEKISEALELCARLGIETKILGFMCLPSPLEESGEKALRAEFQELRGLRDRFFPRGFLNMGTSSDYRIAIEEGADWIRVGTTLFGERAT